MKELSIIRQSTILVVSGIRKVEFCWTTRVYRELLFYVDVSVKIAKCESAIQFLALPLWRRR